MRVSEHSGVAQRHSSAPAMTSFHNVRWNEDRESNAARERSGVMHAEKGRVSIPRLDLSALSGGSSTDVGGGNVGTASLSPMLFTNTIRKSVKPSQISSRLATNTHVKSPVKSWTTAQGGAHSATWSAIGTRNVGGTQSGGGFTPYHRTRQMDALNLTGRVRRDVGLMASHTRAIFRHEQAFAELTAEPVFYMHKFDPKYQEVSPPKTPRAVSPPRHPWQTERTRNVQRATQRHRWAILRASRGRGDGSSSEEDEEEEDGDRGVYTMKQRQALFISSQLTPIAKEAYLKALNIPSRVRSAVRQGALQVNQPIRKDAGELQAVARHGEDDKTVHACGEGEAVVVTSGGEVHAREGSVILTGSNERPALDRDNRPGTQEVNLLDTPVSSLETTSGSPLVKASLDDVAYSLTEAAQRGQQLRCRVLDEWARDERQTRRARIPIPTPEELSDTEIQDSELNQAGVWVVNQRLVEARRADQAEAADSAAADRCGGDAMGDVEKEASSAQIAVSERVDVSEETHSPSERKGAMEQVQQALASHEDYMYTGSLGPLSARRHHQRKEFDAATEMNKTAYNPQLAHQESRKYWESTADARQRYDKSMRQPGNSRRREMFLRSLEDLQSQRPHFHAPSPRDVKTRHKRIPWRRQPPPPPRKPASPVPSPPPLWSIDDSIFAARKRECDARAYYDTPSLLKKQLKLDWQRATAKKRFVKFMTSMDCRVVPEGFHPNELLHKAEAVLQKHFLRVRAAFYYYCARGTTKGEASFSMTSNSWVAFCREMGIEDPESRKCNSAALGSMFVATNYEETGALSSANDKENDDNALMRLEWLEILVRAAIVKYIEDKKVTADVVEALELLCSNDLSLLPAQLAADPNDFRAQRMYLEDVDTLLLGRKAFLEAVFRCYKSKSASKYFWMEHWMTLLDDLRLINDRTGLGITQAKIIFMWSMMGSADELSKRQKAVSWTFVDFIEGLARLADSLPLPTAIELEEAAAEFATQRPPGFTATGLFRHWEYISLMDGRYIKLKRRLSAKLDLVAAVPGERAGELGNTAEGSTVSRRPLSEKMDAFMHLMIAGLCEVWGLPDVNERDLVVKLKRAAAYTGGGVELT